MTRRIVRAVLLLALTAVTHLCVAQTEETPREIETPGAPVVLDGRVLFSIRGIAAYPAERRAAAILSRIEAVAGDRSLNPALIQVVDSEQTSDVMLGERLIVAVTDADAEADGMSRRPLALALAERVRNAIEEYRQERSSAYLQRTGLFAGIATIVFVAALWLVVFVTRRLIALAARRSKRLADTVAIQSFQI